MKQHVINFRVTDEERKNLDTLVNWINHEDQHKFRQAEFNRYWGHVSISHVIRWQLGLAHGVLQARILARNTNDQVKSKTPSRSRVRQKSQVTRSKRKTGRRRSRKTPRS